MCVCVYVHSFFSLFQQTSFTIKTIIYNIYNIIFWYSSHSPSMHLTFDQNTLSHYSLSLSFSLSLSLSHSLLSFMIHSTMMYDHDCPSSPVLDSHPKYLQKLAHRIPFHSLQCHEIYPQTLDNLLLHLQPFVLQ